MGRRSFISMTEINRISSTINSYKREKNKSLLIHSQLSIDKERPPQFTLTKVDFNEITRITRLEFLQTQDYRTITKYVTQNYVRYPIYSDWKTKSKIIKKSIKLTNSELEALNVNEDTLIRLFAEEIIIELNNESLFPSWFIKSFLKKDFQETLKHLNSELLNFKNELSIKINAQEDNINSNNITITKLKQSLLKKQKRLNKLTYKIKKVEEPKNFALKLIFTFGCYYYFVSTTRKKRLNNKKTIISNNINDILKSIENLQTSNAKFVKDIDNYKKEIQLKEKDITILKENAEKSYNYKISKVLPLENTIKNDSSFILLKLLNGLEYEKIIGCYIIHNRENDKYYVGQSKDVLKRLKQHFKGTIPNNPIFAKDYYTSNYSPKDNLFEIKIIKCQTKDELDKTEKQLIYEYDAWNNGYNGTSGNM
ncbi:MAG: GIY-YIG nuclease family protein [Christensenellaceae bacterium]